MIRKNYGLPGILNGTTDSEEELMEQARKAVYKKLGVASGAKPIMHAPTDHDEDLYYVSKIKPIEIKNRLIHESLVKEECHCCEFNERRVIDYKVPLILNFKDLVPETVTVKISCIRKGHVKRFKPFTEEESIRNAQFWDSWKNKNP